MMDKLREKGTTVGNPNKNTSRSFMTWQKMQSTTKEMIDQL